MFRLLDYVTKGVCSREEPGEECSFGQTHTQRGTSATPRPDEMETLEERENRLFVGFSGELFYWPSSPLGTHRLQVT